MPIFQEGGYPKLLYIDAGLYPRVKSAGPSCQDCQSSFPGATKPSSKGHDGTWERSLQCRLGNNQVIRADRFHGIMSDPLLSGFDMVTFLLHATHTA